MSSLSPHSGCPFFDTDDKHVKAMGKHSGALSKYHEAAFFCTQALTLIRQNAFFAYAIFLICGVAVHHHLGGNIAGFGLQDYVGYVGTIGETLGLLLLRSKIVSQGSVTGISGMTITMYVLVYALRQVVLLPERSLRAIDDWAMNMLYLVSLLLVLDIMWSVFKTYRSSYQDDLDIVKLKYLVPGCLVLAGVLHPDLRQGSMFTYTWTACFYLDVMALMPQVAMMARGGGKVEAPIAHFVAATALSRLWDLWYWYFNLDRVGHRGDFNFSGWLIIAFHVLHLLLVVDFIYYYLKAWKCGSCLSQDLSVDIDI